MEEATQPVETAVIITDHAYDRAKERLSLNRKSLDRLAEKAFLKGVRHADTKGRLNKYITSQFFHHRHNNNIRIYGENIFFFKNNILITLYQLPLNLRQLAKICK